MSDQIELIRQHVAGRHDAAQPGCPVCADLPRQARQASAERLWADVESHDWTVVLSLWQPEPGERMH